jgi:small subunit ribosomal protein S16
MLSIRMQRRGRKGHATYRVVVQDSRQSPDSGKFVALLGSYDPHTKAVSLTKDKAQFYLDHGAQPSDRVIKLLTSEGVKLPKWVKEPTKQARTTRTPDKLRKNRPAEEAPAEESVADNEAEVPAEASAPEEVAEAPTEEPAVEETTEEAPKAEESAAPVESAEPEAKA